MELIKNEDKMTVKDLAKVAGVSIETIRRTAKGMFPSLLKRGKKTLFTKDQCFDIIQKVPKKNMVQMQHTQPVEQPTQSVEVAPQIDYEAVGKMIGMAVTAALTPVVDRLDKLSNQKALPQTKQDYYSLKGYCIYKSFTLTFSEKIMHGKQLSKICKRENKKVRKIPDESYGFVNSYPLEVLDEHFSL